MHIQNVLIVQQRRQFNKYKFFGGWISARRDSIQAAISSAGVASQSAITGCPSDI